MTSGMQRNTFFEWNMRLASGHPVVYVMWRGIFLFAAMIPVLAFLDRGNSWSFVLVGSALVGVLAAAVSLRSVRQSGYLRRRKDRVQYELDRPC